MAWWYAAIALGFGLLAIDHLMVGDKAWLIGVRVALRPALACSRTWSSMPRTASAEPSGVSGASGAYHLFV